MKNQKINKFVIIAMIAGPFLSGYIYFVKFELPIITIDLYRMLVVFSLILTLISKVRTRHALHNTSLFSMSNMSTLVIVLFLGMIFVGLIDIIRMGAYNGAASELFYIFINGVVLILLVLNIQNEINLYLFALDVYRITGVAVAALSCLESIMAFELPSSRFCKMHYFEKYSYHPATSIFANENNLSGYLLTVIAVVMWLMICGPRSKKKILYSFELILLIIPGVLADSTIFRLGILLLLVFSLVVSIFLSKNELNRLFDRILPAGIVTCLMLFAFRTTIKEIFIKLNGFFIHGIPLLSTIDAPLKTIKGDNFFDQVESSGIGTVEIRKNLFIYGVKMAKKHIILGFGPDSFSTIIKKNPNVLISTAHIVNPHNFIVELLFQYGGILLILFLFIFISIFWVAIKKIFSKNTNFSIKKIYIIVLLLLLAFSVTTVMPSSFIKSTVYFLPFFIAAIGVDLYSEKK